MRTVVLPESRLRMVICNALSCSFFGSGWLKLVHWCEMKITLSAFRVSSTLMSPPSARRSWFGSGFGSGSYFRAKGYETFVQQAPPRPRPCLNPVHAATKPGADATS